MGTRRWGVPDWLVFLLVAWLGSGLVVALGCLLEGQIVGEAEAKRRE